jgi:hypothetical protein
MGNQSNRQRGPRFAAVRITIYASLNKESGRRSEYAATNTPKVAKEERNHTRMSPKERYPRKMQEKPMPATGDMQALHGMAKVTSKYNGKGHAARHQIGGKSLTGDGEKGHVDK